MDPCAVPPRIDEPGEKRLEMTDETDGVRPSWPPPRPGGREAPHEGQHWEGPWAVPPRLSAPLRGSLPPLVPAL